MGLQSDRLRTVFLTILIFVAMEAPAKAACFFPGPVVDSNNLPAVCGSNGYVTGQIATPGSKVVGGALQDRLNDLVLDRQSPTPSDGRSMPLSFAPSTAIPALRAFTPVEIVPFNLAQADDMPPAAADPGRLGRVGEAEIGLYLTGFGTDESQDRTAREAGSETTRLGFGIGVQIVRPDWLAGIGFDFTDEDTDFDRFRFRLITGEEQADLVNAGRTRQSSKEYGLQIFGLRFFGDSFVRAAGRVALVDHDIRRPNVRFFFGDSIRGRDVAEGDTDGYRIGAALGGGHIFGLTPTTALLLGAGLDLQYLRTDGYSEVLAGSGGQTRAEGLLRVDDDDSLSVQSVLEARLTQRVDLGNVVLLPTLAGRYFHEFASDARDIDYSFLSQQDPEGSGGIGLVRNRASFRTNSPDRNFYHVELGLGIPIGERLFFEVAATKLLGHSFRDEESISAGIRLTF